MQGIKDLKFLICVWFVLRVDKVAAVNLLERYSNVIKRDFLNL